MYRKQLHNAKGPEENPPTNVLPLAHLARPTLDFVRLTDSGRTRADETFLPYARRVRALTVSRAIVGRRDTR